MWISKLFSWHIFNWQSNGKDYLLLESNSKAHNSLGYVNYQELFLEHVRIFVKPEARGILFHCTYLQFMKIAFHSSGCDENGQPQEMSKADFNSSCPYSGPIPDGNIAAFYDFHEIMPESEEIRYEPGAELLFRCVDIGKSF